MLSQTTFHEFVLGVAFLILLVIIGVLLALATAVPAELYALASAIFGVLTGVQIPAPAQRALLARQADQMTALVSSVTQQHSGP